MSKFSLILIFVTISTCHALTFPCLATVSDCHAHGLNLTKTDQKLEPVTTTPDAVTSVTMNGYIPALLPGICDKLPNLEFLTSLATGIEEIRENALLACGNLKSLSLYKNELREITASDLRGLKNLEDLSVVSNKLYDLDIERILENSPKLKKIAFADNNFECNRLKEILFKLKRRNVEVDTDYFLLRQRNYTVNEVEGIHCLTEERWNEELWKEPMYLVANYYKEKSDIKSIVELFVMTRKIKENLETKLHGVDLKPKVVEVPKPVNGTKAATVQPPVVSTPKPPVSRETLETLELMRKLTLVVNNILAKVERLEHEIK